jgi:NADPH2:quinone reductase
VKAIVVENHGDPEVLRLQDRQDPSPGPGEILVEVAAAGVNYMDVGMRKGFYGNGPGNSARVPHVPGVEGAGTVTALGPEVTEFAVGDRVAWYFAWNSYAEQVVLPAASAVLIPPGIAEETAASVMMQGLTAHNLATATYAVQPGDIALVHAAAGGLGLLLTQIIKLRGGRVIGKVSTAAKAEIARAAGADEVVVSAGGDFADEVLRLTGGEGVAVAYDGTGADTFHGSLDSLRHHGVLAYYGQTIKALPPIDLLQLPNSVLVSYPVVQHHVTTREALLAHTGDLFGWVADGRLTPRIGERYPLADAARAHGDLEARRSTGKLLLLP